MSTPVARPRASAHQQRLLALLLATMTLNILDRQVINILAEPMRKSFQFTDTQLGLVTGLAFAVIYNLVSLPLGRFADHPRANRVTIISASLAVWSAMTALCGAAQNFGHVLLARVGVAVGEAGCAPTAHSLIAESFPQAKRARALAIFGLGVPLGAFLGKAGGGLLADAFNWRVAFLIVGLPGLLLAIALLVFIRDPRREEAQAPRAVAPLGEVIREIGKSKAFVNMALAVATAMLLITGGSVWGAVHFQRSLGLSTGEAGFWLGVSGGLAGCIGAWLGGWFADRFGARDAKHYMTPAICGMIATVPFLFLGWWSPWWMLALALIFLPDLFDNLYYGGTFAAIQGLVDERIRATASATLLFTTTTIGTGLGSFSFGFASDLLKPHVGDSESVRYVLMGAAWLYLVPAWFFWRASKFLPAELAARASR